MPISLVRGWHILLTHQLFDAYTVYIASCMLSSLYIPLLLPWIRGNTCSPHSSQTSPKSVAISLALQVGVSKSAFSLALLAARSFYLQL